MNHRTVSSRTTTVEKDSSQDQEELPSLQELQQASDIQRQVHDRYQQLERNAQHSSGIDYNSLFELFKNVEKSKSVEKKLKWPNDHVYIGTDRKKPTYDQLDECQWMLGFLRQRQSESNQVIRENMIEYLVELLQDAVDFSWPSAKGSHYVLIHRLADGLASWSDLSSVHNVRLRYARSKPQNSGKTTSKFHNTSHNQNFGSNLKPVACFKWNKGNCGESRDHPHQGLMLKHVCQICFGEFNMFERHKKSECPRLQKNSKNM